MIALLLHAKASTYFRETRDLLSRLTRVVLMSGILPSALALIVLLLYFVGIGDVYALPWYMLGKSEVISLLANLNARKRSDSLAIFVSDNNEVVPQATRMSTIMFSPNNRRMEGDTTSLSIPRVSYSQANRT